MHLPASRAVAPHLDVLAESASTNVELVARVSAARQPHFSVLATDNQTAGRGRLGRQWVAPPGRALAVSVVLDFGHAPLDRLVWVPLLAGLAMTRTVDSLVGDAHSVSLKWPNDVLVDDLKVSGLLAELVPSAGVIVMGAGLNLAFDSDELPTETSTSLTLLGASADGLLDIALSRYLGHLGELYDSLAASGFDAESSGLRAAVVDACGTIGRDVRVELPGQADLLGVARGIDGSARLIVDGPGASVAVAAGDVTHVRIR